MADIEKVVKGLENGELFKCKWDGEHFNGNNIIAWLRPDDNQTSDDAYKEYS